MNIAIKLVDGTAVYRIVYPSYNGNDEEYNGQRSISPEAGRHGAERGANIAFFLFMGKGEKLEQRGYTYSQSQSLSALDFSDEDPFFLADCAGVASTGGPMGFDEPLGLFARSGSSISPLDPTVKDRFCTPCPGSDPAGGVAVTDRTVDGFVVAVADPVVTEVTPVAVTDPVPPGLAATG